MENKKENLRNQINSLDNEICELLSKRMDIAIEIGNIKKQLDIPVKDNEREQKVLSNIAKKFNTEQKINAGIEIYKTIMQECANLQK